MKLFQVFLLIFPTIIVACFFQTVQEKQNQTLPNFYSAQPVCNASRAGLLTEPHYGI